MTRRMRVAAGLLAFAALAGACRQAQRSDTAAQPVDTRIEQRDSALTALSRTGWVASASGTGSGTAVANAIDGNATTRWRANVAQAANQFFQVDMGSQQTFAAIRLDTTTTPTEFPRSFRVQVSNDNTSWGTVPNVATGTSTNAVTTIPFVPQSARFVRITLTNSDAAFWSIYEFNAYNTTLPRTGWAATASVNNTNAAQTIDSTAGTRWSTAVGTTNTQVNGQFLTIDMGVPQTFSQITLDTGSAVPTQFPRGYNVTTSNDNMTFGPVIASGAGNGRFTNINFPTQQARYVKITLALNPSPVNTPWAVEELNVQGQQVAATTQVRTGWTATASSNSANAGRVLDGSTTTSWVSANPDGGPPVTPSVQIDMGTLRTFTQVTVDSGVTATMRTYQLQIGNSATGPWTTVADNVTATAATVTINVLPQTSRFIKINQTASNLSTWTIREVNVAGNALSRSNWVVAQASPNSSGNIPANALDGSATTRWSTSGAQTNAFFTVDMGTAMVFNQLTLDAGTTTNDFPRNYSVFVSNDGANFGTAVVSGTGTSQVVTINFRTQTARFFKLQTSTAVVTNTWSIQELNAWRIAQPCDSLTCTASDQCHDVGVCSPDTGVCSNPAKPNNTPCSDGNACTQTDTCQAGVCTGANPVTCPAPDQCHDTRICNTSTGVCSNPAKANNTPCSDGNPCTQTDTCQAGVCTGANPVTCPTPDQCHDVGVCSPDTGVCSNPAKPNNAPCSDGNACTQTDTCQGGNCTGANPVTCTALDQCHDAGVCNTSTGACSNPAKPANTPCPDGNVCNGNEVCDAAGTCRAATVVTNGGFDSIAPPSGTQTVTGAPNNDADYRFIPGPSGPPGLLPGAPTPTALDGWTTVANGVEWASVHQLQVQGLNASPDGGGSIDLAAFTFTNGGIQQSVPTTVGQQYRLFFYGGTSAFDGRSGTGNVDVAINGQPLASASMTGTSPTAINWQPFSYQFTATSSSTLLTFTNSQDPWQHFAMLDGVRVHVCDGSAGCTGGAPPTVDDGNACTADSCSATGGITHTPVANGTACNDSNACTQTDTCQAGVCTGGNPITCAAQDQCHGAGACNPSTGTCSNPPVADPNGPIRMPIAATASSEWPGRVASATIDGSGLASPTPAAYAGAASLPKHHEHPLMWMTNVAPTTSAPASITFDLGAAQSLNTLIVWNYAEVAHVSATSPGESFTSRGARDVKVFTSATDPNPTTLAKGFTFARANPSPQGFSSNVTGVENWQIDYNTAPDVYYLSSPVTARYVRFEILSNYGDTAGVGLSEVRFANVAFTACNDGNACTQTDNCQAGVCTGSGNIVCGASDQCHDAGSCVPATGQCSNPVKLDQSAGPFWTTKAAMATPRYGPAGVAFGGLTYVFGGCIAPPCGGAFTETVEAYDPVQNAWSPRASMPTARSNVAAETIGGIVYVVGGASLTNVPPWKTTVEAYDPAHDSWSTKASMTFGRAGPAIGAIGGKLYVAGGHYLGTPPGATPPDFVESYDPASDTWTTRGQVPADRFEPAYGVIGGKLYVAGGLAPDRTLLDRLDIYDPATDSWTTGRPMPSALEGPSALVVGGKLYAFGGSTASSFQAPAIYDQVYIYDPASDAWSVGPTMPSPRYGAVATVSGETILLAGGYSATGPTTVVEALAALRGPSCNDGNACTQTDSCQAGACTGANPITCTVQDQCHVAGTCNPATGMCANPRAQDGATCSDGNSCSSGDACQAGTCLPGSTNVCTNPGQARYVSVTDLGSTQGWSNATSINSAGVIVGTDVPVAAGIYHTGYPGSRGFSWSESGGMVYLPGGGSQSYADAINDAGVMSTSSGTEPFSLFPCRYDPAVDTQPVCQNSPGLATGINAAGTVTGWIAGPGVWRMFRLDAGSIEILPSAPGGGDAYGVWIDGDGTVVGMQNGTAVRYMQGRGTEVLADLLPAGSNWNPVNPANIRSGEIVGWGQHGNYLRAFRIKTTATGDVTSIAALPMHPAYADDAPNLMAADGMNGWGEIVGTVWNPAVTMPEAAFVYTDTVKTVDLNALIDPQSGWQLRAAWSINDNHQVVGFGTHDGVHRAFKLTLPDLSPCPASDGCHLPGTRDLLTGVCSNPPKPDGATCSDGAVCTQGETCAAGVCQPPANPYPVVLNVPVDDLGSLGVAANALDINASGTVVGYSVSSDTVKHAWRWTAPGPLTDLSPATSAQAINDSGTIVGYQTQTDGAHAFRSGANGTEDFGNIGDGSGAWSRSEVLRGTYPTSINRDGNFVGNYVVGGTVHGFRVVGSLPPEDVDTLVPGGTTLLYAIGESGTAVGSSWAQAGVATSDRAVLKDSPGSRLVDINDLVVNPIAGFTLTAAASISGDYIAGWGVQDGQYRAFRLKRSTGRLDALTSGWVSSWYWDVNASGDAVGAGGMNAEEYAASIGRAFVFTDQLGFKKLDDLVPQGSGWNLRGAYAINAGGEIAGWGTHAGFDGLRPFHLRLPSGHVATCGSRSMCGGDDGDGICLFSDGVVETSPGHFVAVFGYDNPAANSVHPGVNVGRRVLPDGSVIAPTPSPPADLQPATHAGGYLPVFDSGDTVSWTVGGETVTASASSRHPQTVVIGTNGLGVIVDGQTIVIKPDTGGACASASDGTPCDDGNACTRTDVCQAHVCVGGNPVPCIASDGCHTATCNPTTGQCTQSTSAGTCNLGAFDYDKAGRLIRDRSAELHYDAYDQLREVIPAASPPAFTNLAVDDLKTPGDGETQALSGHSNSQGHVPVAVSLAGGGYRTLLLKGNGMPVDVTAAAGMGTTVYGNAVNDADAVAGTWTSGGTNHAFRYDHDGFHDLPNAGDFTIAYDINNQNQITGYFSVNGIAHGYRHSDATGVQEIPTFGGAQSWGWRVDDLGTVAASAQTLDSPSTGIARFGHAALYQDIVGLQDLNTFVYPPLSSTTLAVANDKQGDWVVGIATQGAQSRAYRLKLSTGAYEDIGWAGSSFAYSVNSAGDSVGWGYTDAGETTQAAWILSERTGFAKLNDLIDPASGWDLRTAGGIDDFGDVVGWGYHNGRVSAYRLRIPVHSSGTGGPMVAEVHTYGYDGLRTSTTTAPGTANANTQVWFTQDYTEHDGNREHYVRVGHRIVAKVTLRPPPGGGGGAMGALIDPRHPPIDVEELIAKILLALLLAGGLAASGAGLVGKKRRPAWVAVTAGPVLLFFVASCDELNTNRKSAATLWERIETVYFHHGIAAGPVLTTNADGTLREERRYEPFGQPVNANLGGTIGPVDFRREQQNSLGKLTNPNTGWSYHGARWMQPQTARWTAPDPLTKVVSERLTSAPWALNPYAFAACNPTAFWDPDGWSPRIIVVTDLPASQLSSTQLKGITDQMQSRINLLDPHSTILVASPKDMPHPPTGREDYSLVLLNNAVANPAATQATTEMITKRLGNHALAQAAVARLQAGRAGTTPMDPAIHESYLQLDTIRKEGEAWQHNDSDRVINVAIGNSGIHEIGHQLLQSAENALKLLQILSPNGHFDSGIMKQGYKNNPNLEWGPAEQYLRDEIDSNNALSNPTETGPDPRVF